MKIKLWIFLFAFLLIPILVQAQAAAIPLENYDFDLGDSGADEFLFQDNKLGAGGGTQAQRVSGFAQFRIHLFKGAGRETDLRLQIFRPHKDGFISFALLLDRIELIFSNASGSVIKKIVLDQRLGPDGLFIIGDSNHGYFEYVTKLPDLPSARKLEIHVFGNYE